MQFKKIVRSVAIRAGLVLSALIVTLLILEMGFRLFYPQAMLSPRYDYLPETGIINFPSVTMRHRKPGVYNFTYTANAERYRGELIPFNSPTTKIVVLGDSHSFGIGVQDDETYSHRLNELLAGKYQVVNLSNGGWGLTHEIARFLSLGTKYHPKIVIIQFCENDPADNMLTPLVSWDPEGKAFVLRPVEQKKINRFRRMVRFSRPIYTLLTGYSQTYNFVRDGLYNLIVKSERERNFGQFQANATSDSLAAAAPTNKRVLDAEAYYNDLLDHFVHSLKESGVLVIMISVQGHLEHFPEIKAKVAALDREGCLTYLETREWFEAGAAFSSPEGHHWGSKAHARIAEELAKFITQK